MLDRKTSTEIPIYNVSAPALRKTGKPYRVVELYGVWHLLSVLKTVAVLSLTPRLSEVFPESPGVQTALAVLSRAMNKNR